MLVGNILYVKLFCKIFFLGLPFMIQALLTAELKIGSSNGLHYCMKHLIVLCRNGKTLQSLANAVWMDFQNTIGSVISDQMASIKLLRCG